MPWMGAGEQCRVGGQSGKGGANVLSKLPAGVKGACLSVAVCWAAETGCAWRLWGVQGTDVAASAQSYTAQQQATEDEWDQFVDPTSGAAYYVNRRTGAKDVDLTWTSYSTSRVSSGSRLGPVYRRPTQEP